MTEQIPWEAIKWPEEMDPSRSPIHFTNELEVAASPETIWSLLVDPKAWRLYGTPQNSISRFFRSRFDIYVIGVFVAWILLFVIGYYIYGLTRGHPALQVFGGFLPGMLAMYIATHVYGMP